jgi:hypothetical protein
MTTRKAHSKKSDQVKNKRGFSPEEVVTEGLLLDVYENPNYPGQKIEIYRFNNYAWVVAIDGSRLVSTWPSRKMKRKYGV